MRDGFKGLSAIAIAVAACGAMTRGQVFTDSSGGKGMTPGSEAAATMPAATSAEEQASRQYLEAKAERDAAAVRYGKEDPKLQAANDRLNDLRTQMAAGHGAAAVPEEAADAVAMPMYPRIVPVEDIFAVPAGSTGSAGLRSGIVSGGAAQSEAVVSAAVPGESAEDQAARAALSSSSVTVDVEQGELQKVFNLLRDQSHANFFVNWAALQATGVDKQTTVTVQLSGVPLGVALGKVLSQAGGAANLAYTVDAGIITISTKDDLSSSKYEVLEMYNVGDFAGAGFLAQYPAALQGQAYEAQMNNLMDTIKSVIAPDTWRDNGGTIGSIREFDGVLIVTQTADNQRAIARFLAQLRAVRGN